jgi:hypothetical protein
MRSVDWKPSVSAGLNRWHWFGLGLLVVVVSVFGVLVEIRSAFLKRRMGDLDVFLRAAWAVRSGADIYTITDDNGFHYHYPPLFAIFMTPLADPPVGSDRAGMIPYQVSVAIWYGVNLILLMIAVHWLASALEACCQDMAVRSQPRFCRRWWALRLLPVLVCLPPIGHSLMRGQVGILLLLLLCGMMAALIRGRRGMAGPWLAGAICLKLIPAYLCVYPLWRRDARTLTTCALGLLVGLLLIPLAVFGVDRTRAAYDEWYHVLVRPGLGAGMDPARAKELLEVTSTDSQSFLAVWHNTLYPDPATRPTQASGTVRAAHWLLGGLLTLLTLLLAPRRREASAVTLQLGQLLLVMILLSPVCHLHYFCLAVPLVMGCLAAVWEKTDGRIWTLAVGLILAGNLVANLLPHIPVFQRLRDTGLATYAALVLWLTAAVLRCTSAQPIVSAVKVPSDPTATAA